MHCGLCENGELAQYCLLDSLFQVFRSWGQNRLFLDCIGSADQGVAAGGFMVTVEQPSPLLSSQEIYKYCRQKNLSIAKNK